MALPDWLIQTHPHVPLGSIRASEMEQTLTRLTHAGWEIVYCGPHGIQARRRKRCNPIGMLLSALTVPGALLLLVAGYASQALFFCALGMLFALLALLDYLRRPDELLYQSLSDLT
ncbi:MAG: hypothetical protein H0T73_23385 [Ardenticatenales bacterium]|nr:hypothetical protein [Ardenticatenales bacterium]